MYCKQRIFFASQCSKEFPGTSVNHFVLQKSKTSRVCTVWSWHVRYVCLLFFVCCLGRASAYLSLKSPVDPRLSHRQLRSHGKRTNKPDGSESTRITKRQKRQDNRKGPQIQGSLKGFLKKGKSFFFFFSHTLLSSPSLWRNEICHFFWCGCPGYD